MEASTQWQLAREAAERYQQVLVPAILGPAARVLVECCPIRSGDTVIDVGCGTGAAARFAAEYVGASGRVIGIDVNAGMIEVAQSLPPVPGAAILWREKSAYELPLADRSIDVSLCAQTLQFLSDRQLALREMHRVLKPGGHVAVSLWCDIRENPYFNVLVEAVERHIGRETAAGLRAAFALSNGDEIRALLLGARFENIQAIVERLDLALPELTQFVPRHVAATPMAPGFNAASEAARQAVVQEASDLLAAYQTDAGVRIPFETHVVIATK